MTRDDLEKRKARREQELAAFIEQANEQIIFQRGSIAELAAQIAEWPEEAAADDAPVIEASE